MKKRKKILICGITGNQGSALARSLSNDTFELCGLTRNKDSSQSKEIQEQGVKLIEGNLDDTNSFASHLDEIDTVFLVQAMGLGRQKEVQQGREFIKLLREKGIKQLVYSSVLNADQNTGVPHFESKNELENFIKESKIDYTILRPASFNENFLNPEITKRLQKGKLVMPLRNQVVQQFISTDDIGKIAAQVIVNFDKYKGKTISIATDEKRLEEVALIFSKVLKKNIKYQKLPSVLTWLIMGRDLHKMFSYMNANNFIGVEDIGALKSEFTGLSDLEHWVSQNY